MKLKVQTDTSDMRQRLGLWANLVGKEVGDGVKQFARVACVGLANTTQPYSGKDEEGQSASKEAKRIGEMSVEADISKVFYTPRSGGFEKSLIEKVNASERRSERQKASFSERIRRYISNNDRDGLRWLAEFFKWEGVIESLDPALHQAARTGRRRNVPKKRGNMYLILGSNGDRDLSSYIKEHRQRAGMGKAGWAVCAAAIPITQAQSSTRGIPAWVTRHMARASGYIVDESMDPINPRVSMTNAMPWVSELLAPSQLREVMEMTRNRFSKYLTTQINVTLRDQAGLRAA